MSLLISADIILNELFGKGALTSICLLLPAVTLDLAVLQASAISLLIHPCKHYHTGLGPKPHFKNKHILPDYYSKYDPDMI